MIEPPFKYYAKHVRDNCERVSNSIEELINKIEVMKMNYVTLLQDFNRIQEDYTLGRISKVAAISDLRSLSNRVYNSELDHDEATEFAFMFDNFIALLEKTDETI